jgi:hypothetical protein
MRVTLPGHCLDYGATLGGRSQAGIRPGFVRVARALLLNQCQSSNVGATRSGANVSTSRTTAWIRHG